MPMNRVLNTPAGIYSPLTANHGTVTKDSLMNQVNELTRTIGALKLMSADEPAQGLCAPMKNQDGQEMLTEQECQLCAEGMKEAGLVLTSATAYVNGDEKYVACVDPSPELAPSPENGHWKIPDGQQCYYINDISIGSNPKLNWFCKQWTQEGTMFPCGYKGEVNGEYNYSNCTVDTAPYKYTGGNECAASGMDANITTQMCSGGNDQNCVNTLEYTKNGEYQWPCFTLNGSDITINCGDAQNYGYPCAYMPSLCDPWNAEGAPEGGTGNHSFMNGYCDGLRAWCAEDGEGRNVAN